MRTVGGMDTTAASEEGDRLSPELRALSDAVLTITSELSVEAVLQKLVHTARRLVRARYAALGVPDEAGGFARFLTSGMSDAVTAAIGPLPRRHGLLAAMLTDTRSYRTRDITGDPRFAGWPPNHPDMRSFLGVPISSKGTVIGAFYLTDREETDEFTERDQQLIELLAAHAAITIETARLYERNRELTIVHERNRLARDLHDSTTQQLFGAVLTAEAAGELATAHPDRARVEILRVKELCARALAELRSIVFELRPADLGVDGLVPTLRKHVEVLRRVHDLDITLGVHGERDLAPSVERELFRIAQEALTNALKHAEATRVSVEIDLGDVVRLEVGDDGCGFNPAALRIRSRHLGLTSMEERARALGGRLAIDSRLGAGTIVRVEVPRDR